MTLRVIAVVVSQDKPDLLAETLRAITAQTRQPDSVVVVESSKDFAPIEAMAEVFAANEYRLIRIAEKTARGSSINSALLAASEAMFGPEPASPADWFWILQDDTAPEPTALARLLETIERSPSVAIAAPKLVQWQNPRQIIQLGMTLSPGGQLFAIAANQLDQSQHDEVEDVLAVGFSGTLLRVSTYRELGGFDDSAPSLAVHYDFSIRARLGGHRVVVVPTAKVRQALQLAKPGESATQPENALAVRKAEIHLRLAFLPALLAFAYWLVLPLTGVAISILRLAQKRPNRIGSELGAAAWGFLTIGRRWASRSLLSARQRRGFAKLNRLRASWSQLRAEARRSAPPRQTESIAAESGFESKSFIAAGGAWLVVALLALSFALWPKLPAVSGGSLIPLSDDWFQLFGRAGAAYQALGNGFIAPSDPLTWLLSAIGALTFWQPSLAIAALLFCSKALAFIGFWQLASLVTHRASVKNLTALGYALFPLFLTVQLQGRFSALVLAVAAPWLVLAVTRLTGVGLQTALPSAQKSWSLVGLAGLLLAAVGSAAPNTIPVLLVFLLVFAVTRFRRAGYLIWVGMPLAALFTPLVAPLLTRQPLALLLDPGVAVAQPSLVSIFNPQLWILAAPALLALISLLMRRWGFALWVWLLVLLAIALAWFNSKLIFESDFGGQGSAFALLQLASLGIFVLVALTLEQWASVDRLVWLRIVSGLLLLGSTAMPGAVLAAVEKPDLSWSDGRVVPSIVAAEAKQGSQLRLLTIRPAGFTDSTPTFSAKLIAGDGLHLEDTSVAYAFTGSDTAKTNLAKQTAQLVANLVSGNGIDLRAALKNAMVGYVLLPPDTSTAAQELSVSLDATAELEAIGSTDFGQLWRVRDPASSATVQDRTPGISAADGFWSITKITQLVVLLGFTLLALPSASGPRRVRRAND